MTAPISSARQRHFAPSQLTGPQLAVLRSLLTDALDEQRQQLEQQEGLVALTAGDTGATHERETARMAVARAAEAIADIEHALARFDDNTYGTCELCGRAVPFERLEAIPHTRYCVSCPRPGGLLG
jgi:RNA polymerase-binding transcription factor DksA